MKSFVVKTFAVVCLVLFTSVATFADGVWLPGAWDTDQWNPNSRNFTDNGGGLYTVSVAGQTANARYQFKIVEDSAGGNSIGEWSDTVIPAGNNAVVYADAGGSVTVDFDTISDRYIVSNFQSAAPWFAVGDFQSEAGAAGDWTNNAPQTQMTNIGGGIFQFISPILPTGSYQYKATTNGWDFQVGTEGTNENGTTIVFAVDGSQNVVMTMNSNTQSISLQVVPEPGTLGFLAIGGLLAFSRRKR